MISFWIVSSKSEGPNGLINVHFRPESSTTSDGPGLMAGAGSVMLSMSRAEAAEFEPGVRASLTIASAPSV